MTPLPHRGRGDRGASDALGLALMAPAIIGLALVVLLVSREVDTRATAQSAAEAAAQAAAQERNVADARAAALRVVDAILIDDLTCASPTIAIDTGNFVPGGEVSATVSCTTSTTGLEPINAPSRGAQSFTAYAIIDPFRGVDK